VYSEVMERVDMFAGEGDVSASSSSASALVEDEGTDVAFVVLDFGATLGVLEGLFAGLDDCAGACSSDVSAFVQERVTRFDGSGADVDSVVLRFLGSILAVKCTLLLSTLLLEIERVRSE
jgi:hypothetical protein